MKKAEKHIIKPKEHVRTRGVVKKLSANKDHREKMKALDKLKALDELVKLQKESDRREKIILVVSIIALVVSVAIRFL